MAMGRDPGDNGPSGLPAPYRNPWLNLADDLWAVLADLRLRLRRHWRITLAAASVVVLVLLIVLWNGLASASRPATPPPLAPVPPAPLPLEAAVEEPAPVVQVEPQEPAKPEEAVEPEQLRERPLDPLQAWLSSADAAGLVATLEPLPAERCLRLRLLPAFAGLSPSERQRRAEAWQELAAEFGYDHLELRDAAGRLLGRDALVGGGMIVLSSSPAT